MAQTPLTSATPYATNADMIIAYDVRTLGQLLSDTNTSLTSSQVANSSLLTTLLLRASGRIESACVAGRRYLPVDLNALTGAAAEFLVDLTCDLCFGLVLKRRPILAQNPPEQVKDALMTLQALRGGDRIFPTEEAADAGMTITRLADGCLVSHAAYRMLGIPCCGKYCPTSDQTTGGSGCCC